MKLPHILLLAYCFLYSAVTLAQPKRATLIDKKATKETVNLYNNLHVLAGKGTLFGHHETVAYGVGWWGEEGRSDVKELTGSYPAVHGWDLGKIGTDKSINGVPFADVLRYMQEAHARGGINTIAWHMDNLVSGGNSWDTTNAVVHMLPGGKAHAAYLKKLDLAADFLLQCRILKSNTLIPVIFRPFHEHNGDWFWWGKGICTEQEYIQLWRFTVDYLKNKKGLHNLVYAFSPDRSRMDLRNAKNAYLYGYPGDNYVDIIGLDDYWDMGFEGNPKSLPEQRADLTASLKLIHDLAREKGKIAALTETGLDRVEVADWYTGHLLKAMQEVPALQLSYIMMWRNANTNHHYVPYRGHQAEQDFKKFASNDRILLEQDIQHMFSRNKPLLRSAEERTYHDVNEPARGFIRVEGTQFMRDGAPYYFLGANYWYGMNLASTESGGNRERLLKELDHLKTMGVNNLRIMAGTEGPDTEPHRVKPALQPQPGTYNQQVAEGLDFLLAEMAKRDMTAVMVMNNFWEWTGGMGQYIVWANGGTIPYAPPAGKGDWDSFQKFSASFYSNVKANEQYRKHLDFIINRKNTLTGIDYKEDPTIMAWQLGNEPRGYNNQQQYREWVHQTAAYIKQLDAKHLVSIGTEGNTGSHHAGNDFYEDHLSAHIDYATMHIWIQNWAWFDPHKPAETMPPTLEKAKAYIATHVDAAKKLKKPLVIEEFGVARDNESFTVDSPTLSRDAFYKMIFEEVYQHAKAGTPLVGCNFWTYAGLGRPQASNADNFWKPGDDLLGDPPHEKQGWYSVFDTDASTLAIIRAYAARLNNLKADLQRANR